MKKILLITLIFAGIVSAQSQERVHQELKQTDELIKRARDVVEPANNPEAQKALNQAIEIQNSAWDGYRRKRFRWAYSRTLAARQKARDAIEMIANAPERVQAEIQKTAELMNEARPAIIRMNDPRARELWQMAEMEQSAARDYLRQRRLRLALRFTLAARNHVGEVLGRTKRLTTPEGVKGEIERTQRLIEKIQEQVQASHNTRAQEMLSKASEWQVQAYNRFQTRLFVQALKFTFASRDLILRAWEMATIDIDTLLVQLAVTETEHLLDTWSTKIANEGESEAQRLLDQAVKHQNLARQFRQTGNLPKALQETNQARRLLNRAIELLHIEEPASERD